MVQYNESKCLNCLNHSLTKDIQIVKTNGTNEYFIVLASRPLYNKAQVAVRAA